MIVEYEKNMLDCLPSGNIVVYKSRRGIVGSMGLGEGMVIRYYWVESWKPVVLLLYRVARVVNCIGGFLSLEC